MGGSAESWVQTLTPASTVDSGPVPESTTAVPRRTRASSSGRVKCHGLGPASW